MLMLWAELGLAATSAVTAIACLGMIWRNGRAMDKKVSLLMQAALHAARQNNASAKAVSDRLGELIEQEKENKASVAAALKAVQRENLRRAAEDGLPIAPAGAANDAAARIAGADFYEHLATGGGDSAHLSIRRVHGIETTVDGGAAAGRIRKLRSVEDFFGRMQARNVPVTAAPAAVKAAVQAAAADPDTYTRRMNKPRKTANG